MIDAWLIGALVVAAAAVLVIAFHRRIIRAPDGRGRGPLVAGALIILVIALVLAAALFAAQ